MRPSLHATLDDIYARYHKPEFMRMDPIEYVRKFREPRDIEIVGLLASSLAYGRLKISARTSNGCWHIMGIP